MPFIATLSPILPFYAACILILTAQFSNLRPERTLTKLGNAEYPDTSLAECLRIARQIRSDFGGEVRRASLAHVLGMSPGGGAFGARLGSLRMWGIVEGRSVLRLTQTAANVVAETEAEALAIFMSELVQSVPFFVELINRIPPGNSDRAVLAATVQEVSEAPMVEVESRLPQIERLLGEARQHMKGSALRQSDSAEERSRTPDGLSMVQQTPLSRDGGKVAPRIELRFSGGDLSVEETEDNIDLLITALVTRKHRLDAGSSDVSPSTDY